MNTRKLLLINNDPKNLRILKNNFSEIHYEIDEALNDTEAIKKMKGTVYDGILTEISAPEIDGYKILAETQKTLYNQYCAVIFLTQKTDIWNRTKSFKLGAKDYIIKPIHVREIIVRVNMILNRINCHKKDNSMIQKKFPGRLEELNLFELIEIFGLKRKTGILSLYNENNCSGKVFFKNGAVINASGATQNSEEVIYKMMAWRKGRFSMLFTNPDILDEIGVSNMGLLLQGAKRMEQREQLLRQLPSLEAVLVTTANFKKIVTKKNLASDLEYFVSLFDGEHTLGRIVDESKYDEITTLQRILKLYELGFLHTLRDFKTPSQSKEELVTSSLIDPDDSLVKTFTPEELSIADETLFSSQTSEELLTEELAGSMSDAQNVTTIPASSLSKIESEPSRFQDFSIEGFGDLINQDLSPIGIDANFEKDVFFEMRQQKDQDSSKFENELAETKKSALLSPLELLDQRHPADALLSVDSEPDFVDIEKEPPRESKMEDHPAEMNTNEVRFLERELSIYERFREAHGSVLILSTNTKLRKDMVSSLAHGELLEKKIFNGQISDIYLGTAEFKGGHLLNILGVAVNKEFASVVDFFSESILGYIVVIDAQEIAWHYYQYLLRVLREKIRLPFIIVLTQTFSNKPEETIELFRKKLMLTKNEYIKICDEFTPINSRRIVFSLFELYYAQKKQNRKINRQLRIDMQALTSHANK